MPVLTMYFHCGHDADSDDEDDSERLGISPHASLFLLVAGSNNIGKCALMR